MLVIVCMSLAIQEIILTSQIIEWYLPMLFIETIKFYKMIVWEKDDCPIEKTWPQLDGKRVTS